MSTEVDLIDIVARLARLEAEQRHLDLQQMTLVSKMDTLLDRFTRYEAKWGGVVMVLSAIIALLVALKAQILGYFSGR